MGPPPTGVVSVSECKIEGCINDAFENGYCEDCLNDMAHGALDLAGVP